MKKLGMVLLFVMAGSAGFVAGFYKGLDQKETMKLAFRTALHQGQINLKSLQLQTQPESAETLLAMTQRSLELNLQSMVLLYMADYEIDQSSFKLSQNLIKGVNELTAQQHMVLYSDKQHWSFPETVSYIQSNLDRMAKGKPADKSTLEKNQ